MSGDEADAAESPGSQASPETAPLPQSAEPETAVSAAEAAEPDLFELLVEEFRLGGLPVALVPGSESFPTQLVVAIDGAESVEDGVGVENLRINTYFVPGVTDPPAMQYFVTLPYEVVDDAAPAILRFIAALNANLPITGFEFAEAHGVVVFRHTHAVSVRPLDPGVIAWTWSMIGSSVAEFGPLVREVCRGGDPDDAIVAMTERFAGFAEG